MPEANPDINAMPTKELFIDMLTKDIDLAAAITDLVDNSVDAAHQFRGKKKLDGLWVKVETGPNHFIIEDNCGGIDLELARKYAFRFGRPDGFDPGKYAVGQFGVGMKRALFKIGRHIHIESRTQSNQWELTIPVKEWSEEKNWTFNFDTKPSARRLTPEETGIKIEVLDLYPGISAQFGDTIFRNDLHENLQAKHYLSANNGLRIVDNNQEVKPKHIQLLSGKLMHPMRDEFTIGKGRSAVEVRLYCGILDEKDKNPKKAGWYVYCNSREILHADQRYMTGWGEGVAKVIPRFESLDRQVLPKGKALAKDKVPRYHNQFSLFRGFVFMTSEDGSALPWNTTKTDVEMASPVYQAIRQRMIAAMRPVIDYLNALDREIEAAPKSRALQDELEKATPVAIEAIPARSKFEWNERAKPPPEQRDRNISYSVSEKKFEEVRKKLGVRSAREVGERTFDYYHNQEID